MNFAVEAPWVLAGLLFMLIVPAVLYGPQSGFAQELVHGRLPADRDSEERRLERERDQRADGQAQAFPRGVDRENRDSRGEAAQQCAKLVAGLGQRRRSISSASASDSSTSRLVGSTSASWSWAARSRRPSSTR